MKEFGPGDDQPRDPIVFVPWLILLILLESLFVLAAVIIFG